MTAHCSWSRPRAAQRTIQPAAESCDALPWRIDDDQFGRPVRADGKGRGVARLEVHPLQPCLIAAQPGRNNGLTAGFNARDVPGGTAQCRAKPPTPQYRSQTHPASPLTHSAPLPVQGRSHVTVRLEEALRPEVQVEVIDTHPQRGLPGEQ